MPDSLLMTAFSTWLWMEPKETISFRKTSQHWRSGNEHGRWALTRQSAPSHAPLQARRRKRVPSSLHIHSHSQVLEVSDASKYLRVNVPAWWSNMVKTYFRGSRESKPNSWIPAAKLQTMHERGEDSNIHHNGQTSARLRIHCLGSAPPRRHQDPRASTTTSRQICVQWLYHPVYISIARIHCSIQEISYLHPILIKIWHLKVLMWPWK